MKTLFRAMIGKFDINDMPKPRPKRHKGACPIGSFKTYPVLDHNALLRATDRNDPACPYHQLVGQDSAINQLLPLMYEMWQSPHRSTKTAKVLVFRGPPSVGKTEVGRLTAKGAGIPLIERNAAEIVSTQQLFDLLVIVGEEHGCPLIKIGERQGRTLYRAQPVLIFLDELHALGGSTKRGKELMNALLKVLEAKDKVLSLDDAEVDVSHILWIGATTEFGKIRSMNRAFASRLTPIDFENYTTDEVAEIVQRNFADWDMNECRAAAIRGGLVPRQALTFAKQVGSKWDFLRLREPNTTRLEAIQQTADERGIDEGGLSRKQITLLSALADVFPKGMTYDHMAKALMVEEPDLREDILPGLRINTKERYAYIAQPQRTFITQAGADALLGRGLLTEVEHEEIQD